MWFSVLHFFSFPILLRIVDCFNIVILLCIVDCFISSGHNSGEEGLGKSINIAVEQSPGEEWTYGLQ